MPLDDLPPSDEVPAPMPDTCKSADLKTSEMLALWTIRAFVWSIHETGEPGNDFMQGINAAGCPDAARPLTTLLRIVGTSALREIEIHKPACGCVCPDEKRFLHALAAQQTSHTLEAFDVLGAVLPGTAIRLALGHAEAAAAAFGRVGLFFPDRMWSLEELSLARRLRAPRTSSSCVRYMLH